jgi:protein-arginine kinase activator protein McsA
MKVEFRQVTCPVCFTKFVTASKKRKFCSNQCYRRYWSRASMARRLADPERKRKSLERLLAWKEAHRKPKQEKEGWLEITII